MTSDHPNDWPEPWDDDEDDYPARPLSDAAPVIMASTETVEETPIAAMRFSHEERAALRERGLNTVGDLVAAVAAGVSDEEHLRWSRALLEVGVVI